jgi:hypothetical protein
MTSIDEIRDELKRANHLLYVSLKYTRTCDIVKNAISRMVVAYELMFLLVMEKMKDDGKISSIPPLVIDRAEAMGKYKRGIKEYIDNYLLLKEIDRASFERREEYRKGVTLIAKLSGGKFEIDIPKLMFHYEKSVEFVNLMEEWLE